MRSVHLLFLALLSSSLAVHGAPLYSVAPIPLGAAAINNSGQIAGTTTVGGVEHAALFTGGTVVDLGLPSGSSFSLGNAINNYGQVAGEGFFNAALLWTPITSNAATGSLTTLGDINGPNGSERIPATGINDSGEVVGNGWDFYHGGGWKSFLWKPVTANSQTGSMVTLGGGGGTSLIENSINASGEVVGADSQATLWKPATPNGTVGDTVHLGLLRNTDTNSVATKINTSGQIVGYSGGGAFPSNQHAFLWTPTTLNGTSGSMTDLGDLPTGGDESDANSINSSGVVVGESEVTSIAVPGGGTENTHAFIWNSTDKILDLNQLLDSSGSNWILTDATDINDAGQIVGRGIYDPDGPGGSPAVFQAFLLTPVPEPSAFIVILSVMALPLLRYRSRVI